VVLDVVELTDHPLAFQHTLRFLCGPSPIRC